MGWHRDGHGIFALDGKIAVFPVVKIIYVIKIGKVWIVRFIFRGASKTHRGSTHWTSYRKDNGFVRGVTAGHHGSINEGRDITRHFIIRIRRSANRVAVGDGGLKGS